MSDSSDRTPADSSTLTADPDDDATTPTDPFASSSRRQIPDGFLSRMRGDDAKAQPQGNREHLNPNSWRKHSFEKQNQSSSSDDKDGKLYYPGTKILVEKRFPLEN